MELIYFLYNFITLYKTLYRKHKPFIEFYIIDRRIDFLNILSYNQENFLLYYQTISSILCIMDI
jgi:hypothetical protein